MTIVSFCSFLCRVLTHEGSFEIKTPGEGKAKKAQPLVTPHQKKGRKLKFLIRTWRTCFKLLSPHRSNKHVQQNKQIPANDRSSIGRWTILQNLSRLDLQRTFVSNFLATPISIWLFRMVVRQIYANITFTRHSTSLFMHLAYSYNLITLSKKCS